MYAVYWIYWWGMWRVWVGIYRYHVWGISIDLLRGIGLPVVIRRRARARNRLRRWRILLNKGRGLHRLKPCKHDGAVRDDGGIDDSVQVFRIRCKAEQYSRLTMCLFKLDVWSEVDILYQGTVVAVLV